MVGYYRKNPCFIKHWDALEEGCRLTDKLLLGAESYFEALFRYTNDPFLSQQPSDFAQQFQRRFINSKYDVFTDVHNISERTFGAGTSETNISKYDFFVIIVGN